MHGEAFLGGGVEAAAGVDGQAIAADLGGDLGVGQGAVRVDLGGLAYRTVSPPDLLAAGSADHAVGGFDAHGLADVRHRLAVGGDAAERAVEDVLRDGILLGLGRAELGEREVDVAVRGEPEVVRGGELLSVAAVGEDGLGAVFVAAYDGALIDLAEDQAALRIDDDTVGARLAVEEELAAAFGGPALHVIAGDIREIERLLLRVPGWAFGELVALADFLGGTFGEDLGGGSERGGEQGGGQEEGAHGGGVAIGVGVGVGVE